MRTLGFATIASLITLSSAWGSHPVRFPKISAPDLLPHKYLEEIRERRGGEPYVTPKSNEITGKAETRAVSVAVEGKQFLHFQLVPNKSDPASIKVDYFRSNSPFHDPVEEPGNFEAHGEGMPLPVLRHFFDRLQAILRSNGYKRIEVGGMPSYQVLMLYRKVFGFTAATPEGQSMIDFLDRLYRFSHRSLPETLRAKNMSAFTEMLENSSNQYGAGADLKTPPQRAWRRFRESGKLAEGYTLIRDTDGSVSGTVGTPIGMVAPHSSGEPMVVYANLTHPDQILFGEMDWNFPELTRLRLTKELAI